VLTMIFGVLREKDPLDRRVALTPPVVRQLVVRGNSVWMESGAGERAMFRDDEYIQAGAFMAYSGADVIRRSGLVLKLGLPSAEELEQSPENTALMAFYHMAAADPGIYQQLHERKLTAIGCEIISTRDGHLPVLAAMSEIAGQMTVAVASQLLRSSAGGRGILLGGSPGVPPARVVVLGAGVVGTQAAKTAVATGASVTVLDIDIEKLRHVAEHIPNVTTILADEESIATALASADVVIGAVLIAGTRAPHVVTAQMVEGMQPGSVIIDVAIDQGGCVETSRPTTLDRPVFTNRGVLHYCVPNLTADVGRSTSIAVAQAMMPYLLRIAAEGLEGALRSCPDIARGVYAYRGQCAQARFAAAWKSPYRPLFELLDEAAAEAGSPASA
jgi:alanine dehydrogenase